MAEKELSLEQLIHQTKVELQVFNLEGLLKFKVEMDSYITKSAKDRILALKNEANDLRKATATLENNILTLSEQFNIK